MFIGEASGGECISIRAPARGATPSMSAESSSTRFQFAPLREGRRRDSRQGRGGPYFNSRPCERGDAEIHQHNGGGKISIRAPARGATFSIGHFNLLSYFNSRPCERGDTIAYLHPTNIGFQFAPLREGRLFSVSKVMYSEYFNSRPCERGD